MFFSDFFVESLMQPSYTQKLPPATPRLIEFETPDSIGKFDCPRTHCKKHVVMLLVCSANGCARKTAWGASSAKVLTVSDACAG